MPHAMDQLVALFVSDKLPAGRDGAMDITYLGVALAAALILLQIVVSVRCDTELQ